MFGSVRTGVRTCVRMRTHNTHVRTHNTDSVRTVRTHTTHSRKVRTCVCTCVRTCVRPVLSCRAQFFEFWTAVGTEVRKSQRLTLTSVAGRFFYV